MGQENEGQDSKVQNNEELSMAMTVAFAFAAVSLMAGMFLGSAVLLVMGLYFCPPVRRRFAFDPSRSTTLLFVLGAGLTFLFALTFDRDWRETRDGARTEAAQARAWQEEEARDLAVEDSLRAIFEADGPMLITQARAAMEDDATVEARALLRPFAFIEDPELHETIAAIEERRAEEEEAEGREETARREAAVSRLNANHDRVSGITWYRHPEAPRFVNTRNGVYLYMGQKGDGPPFLRFVVQYVANDWLFVERLTFSIDGEPRTFRPGHFGVERDNRGGRIWEWWDTPAQDPHLRVARAVAESQETILRYHGRQYHRDRTVTAAEKRALRQVLEAYELLR